MGLISGLWLTVLGILGASNLIIARKPDAKELIAKLAPYQGWIGAVSALWGVWATISAVISLGLIAHFPVYWATWLANGLLETALGLLLGVGVLKTFIKNQRANERLDQTNRRLAPYQGTLGLIAVGAGAWMVIAGFVWTVS